MFGRPGLTRTGHENWSVKPPGNCPRLRIKVTPTTFQTETLTQSYESYGPDPYTCKKSRSLGSKVRMETGGQTDRYMEVIALPTVLMRLRKSRKLCWLTVVMCHVTCRHCICDTILSQAEHQCTIMKSINQPTTTPQHLITNTSDSRQHG